MVDGWIFVASRSLSGLAEARSARGPVFDSFDELHVIIIERCGPEVGAVFARPVLTRGNGAAPTTVSWYASGRGQIVRWSDLDMDAQARAYAELGGLLERLRPLTEDPAIGDELRRWLNLPALADCIFLIGGHPVLINWGLLPASMVDNVSERQRLFREGLGRFAPWSDMPPFHAADTARAADPDRSRRAVNFSRAAPATVPVNAAVGAAPPNGVNPAARSTGPITETVVVEEVVVGRPWLAPAVAAGIAALILLLLLIPGVLIYQGGGPAISAASEQAAIDVLRTRIADLQGALNRGMCEPGTLDAAPQSLLPAAAATPRFAPDTSRPPYGDVTAPTALAPPPSNVAPPPAPAGAPQGASSPQDLVEYLDVATVLVLARSADGLATGTGFFINGTDVVTNHHVVEGASAFFVVSKSLGHPVVATLVAQTTSSVPGESDFAVLRRSEGENAGFLKLANDVPRASNVLAFGFPAFVMESDAEFQCLMATGEQADADCVPLGSVTMGVVTAIQRSETGASLVLHSATISEGNSGGPLVDYCGRAVGVNTFGRRDIERVQQLNFAQHASGLEEFLTANGIPYQLDTGGCQLVPESQAAPPVTTPEVSAETAAGAEVGSSAEAPASTEADARSAEPSAADPAEVGILSEQPSLGLDVDGPADVQRTEVSGAADLSIPSP